MSAMKSFLDDNYLLGSKTAERLYHEVAEPLPIIDYHNHLSPEDIADDRIYANLYEAWLAHDHYKWRAMRWAGVDEARITGSAEPYQKYLAWASVVPQLMRSPLFVWTHLELRRYFNIPQLLNPDTAPEIWQEANRQLKTLSIQKMLSRYRVALVATTDDPAHPLTHHARYQQSPMRATLKLVPSFRPDVAYLSPAKDWRVWVNKLAHHTQININHLEDVFAALAIARQQFAELGCRSTDHGLPCIPSQEQNPALAHSAVKKLLDEEEPTANERAALTLAVLHDCARADFNNGWVQQLHLGAWRNVNTNAHQQSGINSGFDVMGAEAQERGLIPFLNALNTNNHLPRTVIYNLNPAHNSAFAVLAGAFQGGQSGGASLIPGRVQWGAPWWFLDQEAGIRQHLEDSSQFGVLSTFVGMLTDSRSPMSFVRHEMFRRILCDVLGKDVEEGKLPADFYMHRALIHNVCVRNTADFFSFEGLNLNS